MESSRIAIIIPAYNEEKTIEEVVNSVKNYGVPIVIDDGSVDNTAKISKKMGAIVVIHKKNKGYDSALNSGFKIAKQNQFIIAITVDADLQHDFKIIPEFIKILNAEADIVTGIRNNTQRISEKIFKITSNFLWGLKDPLCGLKGYKMHVYDDFGFFDTYNSIGTELLIRSRLKEKKIIQIEINTKKRKDKPRFGNFLIANYKILRSLFLSLTIIKS